LNGVHAANGLVLVPVYGNFAGYYELTLVAANNPIPSKPVQSGNQFVFSYPTTAGFTNVLEYTDSLNPANWQPFTTNIGDGTVHSVTNSPQPLQTAFIGCGSSSQIVPNPGQRALLLWQSTDRR
jgi:hypothetical protein